MTMSRGGFYGVGVLAKRIAAGGGSVTVDNSTGSVTIQSNNNRTDVRNGTAAQSFRVYNTYTDETNEEWLDLSWSVTTNIMTIQTNAGSAGGTVRRLAIQPAGQLLNVVGALVTITGGTGGGSGTSSQLGGGVTIAAGLGGTGSGANNDGGVLTLNGGAGGSGSGAGGAVNINGGTAQGGNRVGGAITLTGGLAGGVNGVGGAVNIIGGTDGGGSGATGAILLRTVANVGSGAVGDMNFQTGGAVNRLVMSGANVGALTFTPGALAGGATSITSTPGAHTAVVAEVIDYNFAAHTMTITGGYTTQRFTVFDVPTISAASALTVTTASTVIIVGPPLAAGAGPAAITNAVALNIGGASIAIFASGGRIQLGGAIGTTANQFFTGTQGAATTTMFIGNASITVVSDMRLKTNIAPTQLNAMSLIRQAKVVDFDWNDPSNTDVWRRGRFTGMLAQDTIDVFPWIVNAEDRQCTVCRAGQTCLAHQSFWHVEYEHLVPLLVKGFQEVESELNSLHARISELERK